MFNLNEKYFSISERCGRNHQNKFCLRPSKRRLCTWELKLFKLYYLWLMWWSREHHYHLNWVVDTRTCSWNRDHDDQFKNKYLHLVSYETYDMNDDTQTGVLGSFLISRDMDTEDRPRDLKLSDVRFQTKVWNVLGMQIKIYFYCR